MSGPKRIVIVGGVAGGASAAARARRLSEKAEIIMFERGEHVSFANCGLPYYVGGAIAERERLLVQTPEKLRKRFRIDVRTKTDVVAVDSATKEVVARNLETGAEERVGYDKLILSPGAAPVRPPIPGVDDPRVLTLRNVADVDRIKDAVGALSPNHAVVVGGGYIGLEMAENLRLAGVDVTVVEMMDQVMGPVDPEMAAPVHRELRLHGVDLRLGTSVESIGESDGVLRATLSTGDQILCGMIILAVGVKPDVAFARDAGLAIGERGGIVVDEHMHTSVGDIYAVGDAIEVTDFVGGFQALIPLAGPANRQGRIAADNCFGRTSVYLRTQGTAICKVFDLAVAMTGMSEKALRRANRAYEKVYVHPSSHAGYYPGARPVSLKLLFDPEDGKVLGAQIVGADGVDKRIDVIATAIRAGMTVFDLEDLELAYAPPYGSAKDPVNYAGFVAANALKGDVKLCHVKDIEAPDGRLLLDVRTPAEFDVGTIPDALNIPLDDLRDRLGELPKDREILVFCQVGLRGYLACRILSQNGFDCSNLTGGYKTYRAAGPVVDEPQAPPRKACTPAVARNHNCDSPSPDVVADIDATCEQCPGPIMRLKAELDSARPGQAVAITAADPGFAADIEGWCRSTGNRLLSLDAVDGTYRATVQKCEGAPSSPPTSGVSIKQKTIVVFSGEFDKAMAAFIIANGAASMGSDVTLFFTFWGLNVLRKDAHVPVEKTLIERMFGWMMPRGAPKLGLSRMNMGGLGTRMIKGIMKEKNVLSLEDLIDKARSAGVRLVACTMSMGLMGIKKEELIDGVEEGGVAMYLGEAERGTVNLFV